MAPFLSGKDPLTRTWMKGNLKWLLLVLFLLGLLLLSGAAALLSGTPSRAAAVFIPVLALLLYVYFFTGLENGLFLKPFCRLPGNKRQVALTFDDGPHPEHTPRIMEALARAGVRGTFFFLGRHAAAHPGLARRLAAEGHDIGSHGFDHSSLRWAGGQRAGDEIDRTAETFRRLGLEGEPSLFRPPHGAKSPFLERQLRRRGYTLVHWSLSPKDWKAADGKALLTRMLRYLEPGSIILLHDLPLTAGILPDFIAAARKEGYDFVTIREALRNSRS